MATRKNKSNKSNKFRKSNKSRKLRGGGKPKGKGLGYGNEQRRLLNSSYDKLTEADQKKKFVLSEWLKKTEKETNEVKKETNEVKKETNEVKKETNEVKKETNEPIKSPESKKQKSITYHDKAERETLFEFGIPLNPYSSGGKRKTRKSKRKTRKNKRK
jgi:hypothetical protein